MKSTRHRLGLFAICFCIFGYLLVGYCEATALMPVTKDEGTAIHLTQFYNSTYNPDGHGHSNNCGAASLAMCLRVLGYFGYGTTQQITPNQQINHARYLLETTDNATVIQFGITYPLMINYDDMLDALSLGQAAIVRLGGSWMQASDQISLDKALDNGMPVICFGTLSQNWQNQFDNKNCHGSYPVDCPHYVVVTGKTYYGQYIVNDPLYICGATLMNYTQLKQFRNPNAISGAGSVFGTAFYWKVPAPYAITKMNGISYVFMRKKSDNKIYRTYQTAANGSWTNWYSISERTVIGNPVAVEQPNGRLLLFAVGTGKNILMFSEDAYGNMSIVTDFEGETYDELGAVLNGTGRVEFYARGVDGRIYRRYQVTVNGGFSGWDGGPAGDMRTGASGALNRFGCIDLFAGSRGISTTRLMHTWQTVPNGAWNGVWNNRGGHCKSIPTAFRDYSGFVHVFVRGDTNYLYFKTEDDGWWNWDFVGLNNKPYIFGRPVVAPIMHYISGVGYRTDTQVFVRGYNNKTYWTNYNRTANPRTWTNWTHNSDNGTAVSDPAAARYQDGRLYVVVQGTTGCLYFRLQNNTVSDDFASWAFLGNAMDFR